MFCYTGIKSRHHLKLEQIHLMLSVNESLMIQIIYDTLSDISVKFSIGKSEIILICFSAESV